jgi:hypothetical protein
MSWRRALLILGAIASQACNPMSPTPADLVSEAPVSAAFLDDVEWRRLSAKDLPGVPALDLVSAGGGGLIGIGDGTAWRSDEGNSWRQAAGDLPKGAGWQRLTATKDGAIIAVGNDLRTRPIPLISRISVDRIDDSDVQGPGNLVGDVTEFDGRLVAVGGDEAGNGMVWTSQNGLAWSRTPMPGGPSLSVVAADGSRVVAGEVWSAPEVGDGRLGFWHSADGTNWVQAATFFNAGASDIVALPAGFVAVGDAAPPGEAHRLIPAAWSSRDGARWVPMTTPVGEGILAAVTTWRGVPIAVGWTFSEPQRGVVWASRDGVSWETIARVPLEAVRLTDLTVRDDRLVIVGTETGSSADPVVLIGKPPG